MPTKDRRSARDRRPAIRVIRRRRVPGAASSRRAAGDPRRARRLAASRSSTSSSGSLNQIRSSGSSGKRDGYVGSGGVARNGGHRLRSARPRPGKSLKSPSTISGRSAISRDALLEARELLAALERQQAEMRGDDDDAPGRRIDRADDRLARLAPAHRQVDLAERLDRPAAQHDVAVVAVPRRERPRRHRRPAEQLAEVRERVARGSARASCRSLGAPKCRAARPRARARRGRDRRRRLARRSRARST